MSMLCFIYGWWFEGTMAWCTSLYIINHQCKRFLPILVLSHLNFGIFLWGFKCEKVFKLQKNIVRILSLSKYNAHTDFIFKNLKLLKVSDILNLQELKFYYKYKNNKLPHYLLALPFHPNTRTHDHNTCIKHNIHHLIGKHDFAKHCSLWYTQNCKWLPKFYIR